MDDRLKQRWDKLILKLSEDFSENELIDMQSIIFLIGVQELGLIKTNFSKNNKLDLMHIGVCKLLSDYGYYIFDYIDNDGWPHYKLIEKLPNLNPRKTDEGPKEARACYFLKTSPID